jgi:Reverse transcriptase (RNA-dependent DNA polymerase)
VDLGRRTRLGGWICGFVSSHGWTFQCDAVGVMYEAVEDGVTEGGITDDIVPVFDRELEPLIERRLIYDSYACRVGKGTHRALERLQHFLRGGSWVAKLDVRKYFFTIDHEILLGQMGRMLADVRFERLLTQLVGTYDAGPGYALAAQSLHDFLRPRGLPIGNLTSQLFANFYLNPVDRFIKEELKVRRYVRYMDDLVLVASDKATATGWLAAVRERLQAFRLVAHPKKSQVLPVRNGVRFLGFRLYPFHRRILRGNLQRKGRSVESGASWRFVEQQCEQRPFRQSEQQQPVEPEQQQRVPAREYSDAGVRRGTPGRSERSSPVHPRTRSVAG